MFELSIALKYLIPKKKHFSVTIIALISTVVISLVVWLLLVFLSVTEGMEQNWIHKLTSLNAPLKITPTPEYFSSYYYKIDSISNASGYSHKTLAEKQASLLSDPYDPEEDGELPVYWPKAGIDATGDFIDPVKGVTALLTNLQKSQKDLIYQDYEMSGALLKLQLLRNRSPSPFTQGQESLNFLTQVSYLATPPSHPTILKPLLLPLRSEDVSQLFFLAGYRMENLLSDQTPNVLFAKEEFLERIISLTKHIQILTLETLLPQFTLPSSMLQEEKSFIAFASFENEYLTQIILPQNPNSYKNEKTVKGTLIRKGKKILASFQKKTILLPENFSLTLTDPIVFQAELDVKNLKDITKTQDLSFFLQGKIQENLLTGQMSWKDLKIESFSLIKNPLSFPPWIQEINEQEMLLPKGQKQDFGILLPKSFQENNVLLGDKGFLSYSASSTSSILEQRIPIFVAGFYDPGILSVGNKCLLVPRFVTQTINAANSSFAFDKIALNGFQVWFKDSLQADSMKALIENQLTKNGLSSYWRVTTFKEYDFAKDLLQQFQSDKYLFSLVGIIILLVACCNIFSFLILLVNDKKKEIAILQVMGTSRKSIAVIFGFCGVVIGCLGCMIGTGAALITLHNMDVLVRILSHLQGQDAFNQTFYGTSLPNTLSQSSLLFFCIATPLLSLFAGLVPALKACRLHPSSILRSES